MAIRQRFYNEKSDIQHMMALVQAATPDNLHVIDMPYRLSSWAFDYPENVALWEDDTGQVVAWAVMQTPHWAIDYAYLPTLATLPILRFILSWVEERAQQIVNTPSGRPTWLINVYDGQQDSRETLEAAGFVCQANLPVNSYSDILMARSAHLPLVPCSLPDGISLRPFAGQTEVEAYVKLHRSAFGSTNMTPEWRSRVLQRPEYRPDLDLVAVTSEGALAAFCIGWFAPLGIDGKPGGQIEPLGVHPDFQHHGLGRAILTEGLRRLYQYGAAHVYVQSDTSPDSPKHFYESVGFRVAQNLLVYRKDYSNNA